MNISARTGVICKIVSGMVRIIVNDDLIAIPIPAIHVTEVVRCNSEVEAVEPEPIRAAAGQPPDVPRPETAPESAVLPRMLDTIVLVMTPHVVAYPASALIDMGSVR